MFRFLILRPSSRFLDLTKMIDESRKMLPGGSKREVVR